MAEQKKEKKAAQPKKEARAKKAKPSSSRKRKGAARRKATKRLGKPIFLTMPALKNAAAAKAWLLDFARNELASGCTIRAAIAEDLEAFDDIAALSRANAAVMKKRDVPPVLVDGAALVRADLAAAAEAAPASASLAGSATVARAADLVSVCRSTILRVLPGSRHVGERRKLGFRIKLNAKSANSVLAVCKALVRGLTAAPDGPAAKVVIEEDVAELRAAIKAIGAETVKASAKQSASEDVLTERDIAHAALEIFYDKYGAAISMALRAKPKERVDALELIPRRAEQRSPAANAGAGSGDGQSDNPPATGEQDPAVKATA